MTEERIEGETPSGGSYMVAYYLNAHGEPVDKRQASKVEIVEFDAAGLEIGRIYADVTP